MKTAKHYFMHLSILLAVFLIMQAPFAVFADKIDDNESGRVEVVAEGDTMDHNGGEIGENIGTVNENTGTIESNSGTVVNNAGTVDSNSGTVESNNGTVETNQKFITNNNGYVGSNEGMIDNNNGKITENKGAVWNSDGTVQTNEGEINNNYGNVDVNKKSGEVERNYDTVSVNHGEVDTNIGTVKKNAAGGEVQHNEGTVEENSGTVYNSGVVKLNKGKVFSNGGKVVKDQGKHYFRVRFKLPGNLPKNAWSYSVDKGFVSYCDFDRWLEKDSIGKLTFKLKCGHGWEFGSNAEGDHGNYKAYLNNDGTLTIIVDSMNKFMKELFLIIPLRQTSAGCPPVSSELCPVTLCRVTYDLDGGAFNKGSDNEETGIVNRYVEPGTELIFNEIPEKEGYKFVCWEEVIPDDDDAETQTPRYEENDKYIVTRDVKFKAVWEKAE